MASVETFCWLCLVVYVINIVHMIIKTETEREILREGGKRLAGILQRLGEMTKPGMTKQGLEDTAREMIAELGDKPATLGYKPKGAKREYPAALCVSVNDEIVHGVPNEGDGKDKPFKDGDIVAIDCLLNHEGLITDSAITVGVGEVSEEDKRLMEAVKEARAAGIAQAVAGNKIGRIGKAVSDVAKKYGYKLPPELGGHGVGKSVHERPFIPNYEDGPDSDVVLKEGQVIAIEPMMSRGSAKLKLASDGYTYKVADGSQTAHFEHTVIVGKSCAEVLTK